MNNLVASNLTHHPGRTLASVAGVATGVILVVLTVGLVRGTLRDRGQRDANLAVEIMLNRNNQGGISFATMSVSLPLSLLEEARATPGVRAVTPVAQSVEFGGGNALGLRQIDGVDFEDFRRATGVRIVERLPDSRVIFTRDLPVLFANGFEAFNVFLNAVVALALAISLLIILLTSYTTVTERTRQIGILKSLGASKRFIAMVFIKESMLVSAMGVAGGLIIALLARPALVAWAGLSVEIEIGYTLCAVIGGLASGVVGAIYPALRAAGQDAVEALNYE